ncbi:MAG: molybdopterin-dependent oxidoreductase [Pseudomonadota bacterium]
MKLDRRGFIKLVVGVGAGIHLTPLPWKLIDDVSIWTQNWPWVPRVTRYGDLAYAKTVCSLCGGGCGVDVKTVNGRRTVKAEGSPEAPVNRGGVCPLGAAGPQYEYSPARFQSPLKRVGARGSGAFVKITWEEAFKELGAKMSELREKGQAHTVALFSGRNDSLTRKLSARFLEAYGSPNFMSMPSNKISREFAAAGLFGEGTELGYDLENAKYILSFGAGLIEGWGSPVRSIAAFSGWRAKGDVKLVQVDVQASVTASKADQWVAVVPGTEGALALGLASVIIAENLFDAAFIQNFSFGFDDFKAMVLQDYTPAKVSALTGVAEETIVALAREFAGTKPALALGGKAKGDLPTPVYELMAIECLNALVGAVNRKGGVIVRKDLPLAAWPELALDDAAKEGRDAPRLDGAGGGKYPLTGSLLGNFVDAAAGGNLYPVNILLLDRANPAYWGGVSASFTEAMDKIPLIVSFSTLADDTSYFADLILPETSNYEGLVELTTPETLPYPLFGTAPGVFKAALFDCKPAADIYLGLAQAIGEGVAQALPFESAVDMVKQSALGLFASGRGVVAGTEGEAVNFGDAVEVSTFKSDKDFLKALFAGRFWYDPEFKFDDCSGAFKTPSGKFEFRSRTLEEALSGFIAAEGEEAAMAHLGLTAPAALLSLPHYEPYVPTAAESHGGGHGEGNRFPLLLVPTQQFKLVASSIGAAPYLTKLLEDITLKSEYLVVHVNPATARELHLHERDLANLATAKGALKVMVHLFEGARPGVIYAPIGLGHRGFDLYLRGKGVNPIEIIEAKADPLSGQSLWWGASANLTKV